MFQRLGGLRTLLMFSTAMLFIISAEFLFSDTLPEDTDIWILAGQSNMYPGLAITNPPPQVGTPSPRIMAFSPEKGWSVAVPSQLGPGFIFANHIIEATTRSMGLIFCAQGNTSIRDWNPETAGSLYHKMMDQIRAAGVSPRGILWFQGENDASLGWVKGYEESLLCLVDSIRKDTNTPQLPFLYVQLTRFYSGGAIPESWETIREIQRRAMHQRSNMFMVSAMDVPLSDQVHISAEGQHRWARRLAEVALSEVYHVPGYGRSITLGAIQVLNGNSATPSIKVHFEGICGRLKAEGRPADFELRTDTPTPLAPTIFRTDFDPDDPAGILLRVANPMNQPAKLIYGSGAHPFCNIVDERDMLIPAFGPIDIPIGAETPESAAASK